MFLPSDFGAHGIVVVPALQPEDLEAGREAVDDVADGTAVEVAVQRQPLQVCARRHDVPRVIVRQGCQGQSPRY